MDSQFLLLYILKSIVISGVFYLNYHLVLKNKNFHYYNRFYLLFSLIASLIIPLIRFNIVTPDFNGLKSANRVYTFIAGESILKKGNDFEWSFLLLVIIMVIAFILTIQLIKNVIKIYFIKNKFPVTKMDGFYLIKTNIEEAPFSFLNNLFWKDSISLDDPIGQQIFKHELTHIEQKHTLDSLICQLVSTLFWVNPFNWLIQKEIKDIHEFIADESSIDNNNPDVFARMLLRSHYGEYFLNPSQYFFYSSIKRRLFMITNSNKPTFSYARRLMIFPLVLISISVFSISIKAAVEKIPSFKYPTNSVVSKKSYSISSEINSNNETVNNTQFELNKGYKINDTSKPKIEIKISAQKGGLPKETDIKFETIVDSLLIWPVDGGEVKNQFGLENIPNTKFQTKNSLLNIQVPLNSNIKSVKDGEVKFVGEMMGENILIIKHDNIYSTYTGINTKLNIGQSVKRGEIIGKSGKLSNGEIGLEFGLSDKNGNYVDPNLFVRK